MTLSLQDIKLQSVYSSEDTDVLREFYIPALSTAKNYYRITGFFSSDSLSVAAKGIEQLIKNDGKIKLITGLFTRKEDIIVAESAIKNPNLIVDEVEKILKELTSVENLFVKESIKAFAWMLAKGLLEIKLALPKKSYKDEFAALFHEKIGIIDDIYGNEISFSGSINETGAGWLKNIEEFKVFRGWKENERHYFESDKKRFFKLWDNGIEKVLVIPIDKAIEQRLIALAPANIEEINFDILNGKFKIVPTPIAMKIKAQYSLRKYQKDAIEKWTTKKYKGLIEMATGTGKTIVGINAIDKFFQNEKNGMVVIVAPTHEICNQWEKHVWTYLNYDKFVRVSGEENWRPEIENLLHDFKKQRINQNIILTTYDSSMKVVELFKKYNLDGSLFILADEVHSFGAKERRKIMIEDVVKDLFNYRLGLSATPERLYDRTGNEIVNNFFGGIVFSYSIDDAIKDGVLCLYNYFINIIEMSTQEFNEYIKFTKKIGQTFHYKIKKDENGDETFNFLSIKRANICKNNQNKLLMAEKIIELLKKENQLKATLIFCFDFNQLNQIKKILNRFGVIYSQITGDENIETRKDILRYFAMGEIDVLLSIKILDEGIDIPNAINAIILSSSTNPREYVQRRGRVLRKISNMNKIAKIFDFITVAPKSITPKSENVFIIEKKLLEKELTRAFEFVKYSDNKVDIFKNKKLDDLINFYQLHYIYDLLRK